MVFGVDIRRDLVGFGTFREFSFPRVGFLIFCCTLLI